MNVTSTDFAKTITSFLTEYLPFQRCYAKNTILSYRDTLILFLRFLNEVKDISPNNFYIKDFSKEIVIEFLEWYRQRGAGTSAANQRLVLTSQTFSHSIENYYKLNMLKSIQRSANSVFYHDFTCVIVVFLI